VGPKQPLPAVKKRCDSGGLKRFAAAHGIITVLET